MSIIWMARGKKLKTGNTHCKAVLMELCECANDNGISWPSVRHIAEHTEMSERSVQNHIRFLEEHGVVKVRERKNDDGRNRSNIYQLLFREGDTLEATRSRLDGEGAADAPPPKARNNGGEYGAPQGAGDAPIPAPDSPMGAAAAPTPAGDAPPEGAGAAPRTVSSEPSIEPSGEAGEPPASEEEFHARLFQPAPESEKRKKFAMTLTWEPGERFGELCQMRGVSVAQLPVHDRDDLLNEFRSYWEGQCAEFTQFDWEHKLVQRLRQRIRAAQSQPAASPDVPMTAKERRQKVTDAVMDIHDTSW